MLAGGDESAHKFANKQWLPPALRINGSGAYTGFPTTPRVPTEVGQRLPYVGQFLIGETYQKNFGIELTAEDKKCARRSSRA